MTKADIIDRIASATGIMKTDTAAVVEGFLASIVEAMIQHERVEIRGFGTFKVVKRAPRVGRNPRTGETVEIPERYTPVFKPYKEFKAQVEERGLNLSGK